MPKVEIAMPHGRVRQVNSRVADLLVKKGRGTYVTRDLRAAPVVPVEPPAPPAPAAAVVPVVTPTSEPEAKAVTPDVELPKSAVSTAEARARREASKRS